ncbi:ferredoxin [Caballeronia cordobensis]|uniref:Ferredoxin n=1 Tax=Caballeronia cordobensis TaxID=1353886 RepID=A0A158HPJ6_CABCO|nr:PDR/VanB family oxidoreductase [Caballeronia cordobensis]SAL45610.1 ferredoxin [Caballeronia cordobensis]
MNVVVARIADIAAGIRAFELASLDGTPLPAYEPGAHIDVHLPTGAIRQYSLCGDRDSAGAYVIAVQQEAASRGGSIAMHALKAGDLLRVEGPRNHFPLDAAAAHSILFAGGIGITPLLAMAEHLAAAGASFELHYCVRDRSRAAFIERLDAPALQGRAFFHVDAKEGGPALDVSCALGAPEPGKHLYVCGPGGFMTHVLTTAQRAGWDDAHLHREYFSAPPAGASDSASPREAFSVRLANSGRVIPVGASQTVVEALAAHGVHIETSCEQGVCGTCLTRVIAGEPDHRDLYLTDAERAENDQFLPCCSRSCTPELVLDL